MVGRHQPRLLSFLTQGKTGLSGIIIFMNDFYSSAFLIMTKESVSSNGSDSAQRNLMFFFDYVN